MTANWFMEDEMDTRLEEIRKALVYAMTIAPTAEARETYDVGLKALKLLTEIQSEKVDLSSLRVDENQYGHAEGENWGEGWNDALDEVRDHLATRGLLRTNEIEPEGRE